MPPASSQTGGDVEGLWLVPHLLVEALAHLVFCDTALQCLLFLVLVFALSPPSATLESLPMSSLEY